MNIRAFMAALDVWELDHYAKAALLVICGRADRESAVAHVSIPRVAADISVHYDTAARALQRVVAADLLSVVHRRGQVSEWTVNPAVLDRGVVIHNPAVTPRSRTADTPRSRTAPKESLDRRSERYAQRVKVNGAGAPLQLPPLGSHHPDCICHGDGRLITGQGVFPCTRGDG